MKKTNTLYHHSTSKQVRKLERVIRTIPGMENKWGGGGYVDEKYSKIKIITRRL